MKARTNTLNNRTTPNAVTAQLTSLLSPQRHLLQLALGCAVLSALLFIWQCYLLATLFSQWLALLMQQQTITYSSFNAALPGLLLCFIGRPILQFVREQLSLSASLLIRGKLRQRLLQKIGDAGPSRHLFGQDGAISSKLLEQVDALDGFISRYYVQRYLALLTPLMLAIATAFYSPFAAIILLATAPLVPLFMILLGNAAASASQQQFQHLERMSGRFLDLLRGIATIKHLQASTRAVNNVADTAEHYRYSSMKVLRLAFLSSAVLEFFASVAIALLALYLGLGLLGILPWAKDIIPVPYQGALFILLMAPEFYAPLRQLGSDYHAKAQAEAAIHQLDPILNMQLWQHPGTLQPALLAAPAINCSQLKIIAPDQRIRLAKLNLYVKQAERIVLQGPSGSGKSSLLQALLGFIPYQGHIRIDQFDLQQLERHHWRQHIGYLAQQSSIMPGSIAANLRLAKAAASETEIQQALQQVELWSLVQQLPYGMHTTLGERGLGLSGGQLQRLALAQLLLQNARVWLLDEPAAHLDPPTAYRLYQLLGKLSQHKTVIIVSHQLHGLDWVDRVIDVSSDNKINRDNYASA